MYSRADYNRTLAACKALKSALITVHGAAGHNNSFEPEAASRLRLIQALAGY